MNFKAFFNYCLPRGIYLHKSAIVDYQYFYINTILNILFLLPFITLLTNNYSRALQDLLVKSGAPLVVMNANPLFAAIVYTIVLALVYDFGLFFSHYLMHKIPWLWEFHKTHHSAGVLTPITVYRMHPLDDFISIGMATFFTTTVDAVVKCFYSGPLVPISILGLNLGFFLFYIAGYNLRHSHVWLDYGKTIDNLFISPAQHQIHHSTAPRHYDKNLGFIFAIWDKFFGTLYVPKSKEDLEFGINLAHEEKEYTSVLKLYFLPLAKLFKLPKRVPSPLNLALILLIPFALLPVFSSSIDQPHSLQLNQLTSPEVKRLLQRGYTTVIVPIGGTEQAGQHLPLGKHNTIVANTSTKIAQRLGHTLVAPVMPFSPAGHIAPPSAHMNFAGTISIDETTLELLLENVATSLKQHGFKLICFIGDHGGSQRVQEKVAAKLSAAWQGQGCKVSSITKYYDNNGQSMYLNLSGLSDTTIGAHGGVKDTSELLYISPEEVRLDLRKPQPSISADGSDGNPQLATVQLGAKMIEMKIRAAVQQIQGEMSPHKY